MRYNILVALATPRCSGLCGRIQFRDQARGQPV